MRVLLVEDSERLRKPVSAGLTRSGCAVDMAADGKQGLWLATSHDYDAIVLDLMLPEMDGLAVLERLRVAGRIDPPGSHRTSARSGLDGESRAQARIL